jgi:hypothetical protein
VHIILEHFNFEMQYLLNDFSSGKITFESLQQTYNSIGTEGHDISSLEPLFASSLENNVKLHAGFIPWPYAKEAIGGENSASKALE